MARNYFSYGTKFLLDGLEHMVKSSDHREIVVEIIKYKQIKSILLTDLEEAWDEERLVFQDVTERASKIKSDLNQLNEKEKASIKFKLDVLKPVIDGNYHKINLDEYLRTLREVKGFKVSKATFYNWKRLWERYGDARFLLDLKPGPKSRQTEKEVMDSLERIMDENLYSGEKIIYRQIYRLYKDSIKNVNELRNADQKQVLRSFQTIWRILREKRDLYRQRAARDGYVAAKLERDGSKSMSEKPKRPLQRVELDWTPADIYIVDPKNLERKKPWLVYAIDVFSGEPLGFYITLEHPDTFAIKQCLLHCFLPKVYLKKLYPEVQHEWTSYGIPKELVIDNASQNDSNDLEEIFNYFGIDPLYPEVQAGHKKGTVERGQKTFNDILHTLRGTSFSNIYEKKQYDSKGKACITLQAFYYIAHIIFVDIISHNWSHSRMGGTPHQIWEKAFADDPSLIKELPFSKKEITLALCEGREKRIIQNKGIMLEETWYTSDELMKLRYRLIQNGDEHTQVVIRFDSSNVKKVYVENPYDKSFIEAYIDPNRMQDFEKHYDVDPTLPLPFQQMKAICLSEGRKRRAFDDTHVVNALKNIKKIQNDQLKDKRNQYKQTLSKEAQIIEGLALQSFDFENLGEPENPDTLHYIGELSEAEINKKKKENYGQKRPIKTDVKTMVGSKPKNEVEQESNIYEDLPMYGVSQLGV
ncbi:DDE-type integrase/transposase/recombinase [Paenibacillus hemerocallicola]|uniref:DDE-type integrase/transposase/recombinase n=1 Tax=Paenibacillus hemerocallicola TaxID=1172614 RepID=A0A5C4T3X1_9BACL|nr:Mu transposase C-terminal domain-containing protein [Paenibacillus hemerocallicola]TNJ63772.1 DDE-type integrase/transposase/recombinase [Paenibacillus hemerocallicola]